MIHSPPPVLAKARYVCAPPADWPHDGRTQIATLEAYLLLVHPDREPLLHRLHAADGTYDEITLTAQLPGGVKFHDNLAPAKGIGVGAILGILLLAAALMLYSTFDLWTPAANWLSTCF